MMSKTGRFLAMDIRMLGCVARAEHGQRIKMSISYVICWSKAYGNLLGIKCRMLCVDATPRFQFSSTK
jgi:hypothetical protein